jgi:6-pyruvoyltetrahydropterin/6-carboxytetrahydropterin synthase
MAAPQRYSVLVSKEYLKFSSGHFIAYPGFREPLHGHNYQVSVRLEAELGPEGYVLDFGVVKRVTRELCAELDDHTIVPERSPCIAITIDETTVTMVTEDGARFVLPRTDCVVLPIEHSSAEEIAAWLLDRLAARLRAEAGGRTIRMIELGVAEAPGQVAFCRCTY